MIIRENRTIRLDDLMADPRRVGFPPNHPEMHSFLGVPVVVRGRTIGNLYLTEKDGGFTSEDQREIETFARHAAIAMDNARLHDQVQRLAIVEERERIGKDLHDGVIQAIYAVGLSLDDVPDMMDDEADEARRRVERAIDGLDQTIRDIRNFIFGLRPALVDGVDVVEGLAALADEFRVNTMIDVELRAGPTATTPVIGPDRTVELLAIAREALSNIARHARASRAAISVEPDPEIAGLEVVIADNGSGFDPGAPRAIGHQGLRNIRTRAISIGATLLIDSHPGSGTRIIVRVPGARTADEKTSSPAARRRAEQRVARRPWRGAAREVASTTCRSSPSRVPSACSSSTTTRSFARAWSHSSSGGRSSRSSLKLPTSRKRSTGPAATSRISSSWMSGCPTDRASRPAGRFARSSREPGSSSHELSR